MCSQLHKIMMLLAAAGCLETDIDMQERRPSSRVYRDDSGLVFSLIPSGTYDMGPDPHVVMRSLSESLKGRSYSNPCATQPHSVTISRDFLMSIYEITEDNYQAYLVASGRPAPQTWLGSRLPVRDISWNDASEYCKWLSRTYRHTYSLPTEAQWEYACRAGSRSIWYFGNEIKQLHRYAVYSLSPVNPRNKPEPVGSRLPNDFGLFDMSGNVSEMCMDPFEEYPITPQVDPLAKVSHYGWYVARGGDFASTPSGTASRFRLYIAPKDRSVLIGFRVVRHVNDNR